MLTFCINQKRTRLDDLVKALRSRTVNEPVCAERFEGLVEDLKQSEFVRSVAYINFYINMCVIDPTGSPNFNDAGDNEEQYPYVRVCQCPILPLNMSIYS